MFSFKIAAAFLIATLTCVCWAAPQLPVAAKVPAHHGGCHGDGGPAPSQVPAQVPAHNCCFAAQDAAMPQLSHAERPDAQQSVFDSAATADPYTAVVSTMAANFLTVSPSSESTGATPLRV